VLFPSTFSAKFLRATTWYGQRKENVNIATIDTRINDQIRAREVRVIGEDGSQLGVRTLKDALILADTAELDLVEIAPNTAPPVCKIMNYGRFKYEQEQKKKEARKNTTNVVVKEMKFRPKIDGHDYETKMSHVRKFLEEGSKVKLTIMFRGREMAHPEFGRELLNRVASDLEDIAMVFQNPTQDGRNMTMILHPTVKPKKNTGTKQMERGEKKHKNFSTLDRLEGNVEEVEPEVEEELTDKEIRNAKKSKYKKGVKEELDGIDLEF
jgi:translation initiation factor IF-3